MSSAITVFRHYVHMCPKVFFRETQVAINPRLPEKGAFLSPLYSNLSQLWWKMGLICLLIRSNKGLADLLNSMASYTIFFALIFAISLSFQKIFGTHVRQK